MPGQAAAPEQSLQSERTPREAMPACVAVASFSSVITFFFRIRVRSAVGSELGELDSVRSNSIPWSAITSSTGDFNIDSGRGDRGRDRGLGRCAGSQPAARGREPMKTEGHDRGFAMSTVKRRWGAASGGGRRRAFRAGLEALEGRRLLSGTIFTVDDPGQEGEAAPGSGTALTQVGTITLDCARGGERPGPAGHARHDPFRRSHDHRPDRLGFCVPANHGPARHRHDRLRRGARRVHGPDVDGLDFANAGPNTVRGLTVQDFIVGIALSPATQGTTTTGNLIAGCTIRSPLKLIDCTASTIGGTTQGDGNVIVGTAVNGLGITGGGNNVVAGNDIGVDPGGTIDANANDGVDINNSSGNLIEQNVISGNGTYGIALFGQLTNDPGDAFANSIQGNLIGTSPDGTKAIGNGEGGIRIQGAYGTIIGGVAANTISGKMGDGITIDGNLNGSSGAPLYTVVSKNVIGLDSSATRALDTGNGISIGAPDFNIAGNVIGGNQDNGIEVGDGTGDPTNRSNDAITGNLIGTAPLGGPFPNQRQGIDVDGGLEHPDRRARRIGRQYDRGIGWLRGFRHQRQRQQHPLQRDRPERLRRDLPGIPAQQQRARTHLTATSSGAITGTLTGTANHTVQFFAVTEYDAAGNFEGADFLGQITVTIPASGTASLNPTFSLPANSYITATATDPQGDTSEFSNGVATPSTQNGDSDGRAEPGGQPPAAVARFSRPPSR